MQETDPFSKADLFERCESLEGHVLSKRFASVEEIQEYRPPNGQDSTTFEWIWWYAQLVAFCRRAEFGSSETVSADAAGLKFLTSAPISVDLSDGSSVNVYPKSLDALLLIHSIDAQVNWMAARYSVLSDEAKSPEELALLPRTAEAIADQEATIMWIASHPGAWVPPELLSGTHEIPVAIKNATALDRMRIYRAFTDLNAADLHVLEKLLSPNRADGSGRPSWSVFAANMAMKWGGDLDTVTKQRPLISLLATVQLSAPSDIEPELKNG